ncbi:prepilin peptidase [Frigoribacterium sp. PhB24]|uniref:prepilin peptidase n=1 Tax=Frigoribacterium sp. PhB24 TaxID=2485204 RepID=UPI000FAA84AA|nr:A24 family peptidase [Frigoribacterium sp. PhB24]ROS51501.1 hypothetical protein EDF50_1817 [Frigoribacterium sp. PhB24]
MIEPGRIEPGRIEPGLGSADGAVGADGAIDAVGADGAKGANGADGAIGAVGVGSAIGVGSADGAGPSGGAASRDHVRPVSERAQAREAVGVAALAAVTIAAAATAAGVDLIPQAGPLAGANEGARTLVGCLGVAVVTPALVRIDITERRLPNVLVAVAAGAWGVSTALLVIGGDPEAAATSLATSLAVAVVGLVAALIGGLGMGDVKLGAVLSGVVSPTGPMALLVFWGLAGTLAVGMAGVRSFHSRRELSPRPSDPRPSGPRPSGPRPSGPRPSVRDVPFGPCLLAAFWWVVVSRPAFVGFDAVLVAR